MFKTYSYVTLVQWSQRGWQWDLSTGVLIKMILRGFQCEATGREYEGLLALDRGLRGLPDS